MMDINFWIALILGAVLSFLASIVANVMNGRVQSFFDGRRKKINLKRQLKEQETYYLVNRLKTGEFSQAYYFSSLVSHRMFMLYASGLFWMLVVVSLATLRIMGKIGPDVVYSELSWGTVSKFSIFPITIFAAILTAAYSLIVSGRIIEIGRKLNYFEEYRQKLAETYPNFDFDSQALLPQGKPDRKTIYRSGITGSA